MDKIKRQQMNECPLLSFILFALISMMSQLLAIISAAQELRGEPKAPDEFNEALILLVGISWWFLFLGGISLASSPTTE